MKLSVILVSHQAKNSLRLALNALYKSNSAFEFEVIIVDNASDDRTFEMLQQSFPQVRIVTNPVFEGYSRAYNKAIRASKGTYVLLLSPDMMIKNDSIEKLCRFMDQHPLAGGSSVRMVDYNGDYLPESRYGLPAAWSTLLKFSGMANYFPRSFSKQKGRGDWVKEFETSEADTLHSDCMLLRRSALEKTGWFDERFKSFGYNIDMAYRLRLSGFKTYYFSKTNLMQLPGKRLNKFSWTYISHFYGAMFIFATKYLFKLPVIRLKDIGEIYPSQYEVE